MIPSDDIVLDSMEVPSHSEENWDGINEVTSFYQGLVAQIDIWKDPYFLIKKKCPPTFPPRSIAFVSHDVQYVAIPFPELKIRSVSFEKQTMNNLILGPDDILYQLLYVTQSKSPPREWSVVLKVVEYRTQLWIFLARKIKTT